MVTLRVEVQSDGHVAVEIRGPLAGTPEAACILDLFRSVSLESAAGAVVVQVVQ